VLGCGVRLSVGNKGAWRDNVFVEWVCPSIKYEEVYVKAYESVSHAGVPSATPSNCITGNGPIRAWRIYAGLGKLCDAVYEQIGSMKIINCSAPHRL